MIASLPDGVKVIIVDNACEDAEALEALSGRLAVKVLTPKKNLGFGRACNLGAREASTEFLLFLNPDAAVEPGSIEAFLEAAGRYGPQTAFTPKIANSDGSPNFKRRSVLLPRSEWMPRGWPEEECEVPVVSGAAIFVRRDFFLSHGFDPSIFMYHEDDDWSLIVRAAGGRLVFLPSALINHQSGHSSGRGNLITRFKAYHLGKSKVYVFRKYGIPFPKQRLLVQAVWQLILPHNLFSSRKRAKHLGFLEGVRKPNKNFLSPEEMISQTKTPFWKVKRELKRLGRQFKSLPLTFYERFFSTPWYDWSCRNKIKCSDGRLPQTPKVAIFLVFPRNGLLPSHKRSLEYLIENGYSPLVVSNLPFTPEDELYLKENSWRYMERPNVGYDFGGYRDAFLSLREDLASLDRLVLVNDSSWFPAPGSKNWLVEAEALGVDYAAAATSFGISRVYPEQFEAIKWDYDTSLRNFHYGSYAVSIGPSLLTSKRFLKYWKRYALTAEKNKVVRRGEIGMTRFVLKNGFTHGATYDIRTLPEMLAKCTDEEINKYARNVNFLDDYPTKDIVDDVLPLLDATKSREQRESLTRFIMATSARIGISYVLPGFLMEKHGFCFFKKSLAKINKDNSDIALQLAETLEGEDGAIILQEVRDIRSQKGF
ncbi:hypothetical protein A9D60_04905 [Leisingera sp. JC1]|nr:hypothetical protein A9D60_04905 [Leisingera sp. JC1]